MTEDDYATSGSVPVCARLLGAAHLHANVVSLLLAQLSHLCSQCWQVQSRNLLVQLLRQQIHFILVSLALLPVLQNVQLRKNLIGERARHDERWVTCRTAKIAQAAGSQDND